MYRQMPVTYNSAIQRQKVLTEVQVSLKTSKRRAAKTTCRQSGRLREGIRKIGSVERDKARQEGALSGKTARTRVIEVEAGS